MDDPEYAQALADTRRYRGVSARLLRSYGTTDANSLQFASANLHHLLPDLSFDQHAAILDRMFECAAAALLDEESYLLLRHAEIVDPSGVLARARYEPAIFATFHFGSYRLINMVLVKQGLNYVLPVEHAVYVTDEHSFLTHVQNGKAYFGSHSEFSVVDAEQPTSALAMLRKARAGWSILGYLDGHTGVQGADRHDPKTVRISLLGRPIYARKGLAYLAHFLQIPIVPVFTEIMESTARRVTVCEPIAPAGRITDREAFCVQTLQTLHDLLGDYVRRDPGQWQGWVDVHKHLDFETDAHSGTSAPLHRERPVDSAQRVVFNHQRFGIISHTGALVLLDKLTYDILELPKDLFALCVACWAPVNTRDSVLVGQPVAVAESLAQAILVPCP